MQHVWVALATLIFLRWADFQDAEREAIAAFDEDDFTPVLPSQLHWRSWCELPPEQLSETLKLVMGRIVNHEPDSALAVQLSRITPGLEVLLWYPPDVVKSMCDWLRSHQIETPAERLALRRIFDECLASADVEDAGMMRTPIEVVNVMVRLADPKLGESVYDPCIGTGRFLTRAIDYVHKMTDMSDPLKLQSGKPLLSVAGVELDEHQYVIALTRLVLSGVVEPQLERGSSLERDGAGNPHHELFDVVLGNPPWGMKIDTDGLGQYPVPTNDSASLFVQHALSNLRPGGRLMMTVPPSLLFSQKDQPLREFLIEQNQLETVISLPSKLFKPYTSVGFTLLEVVRGGETKSVRFIDGDAIYRENREDLEMSYTVDELCIKFWNHARRPDSNTTYRVEGVSKLADREFDLTPRAGTESKLEATLEALSSDIPIQTLGEVCQILRGHNIPTRELMESPPRSNYKPSGTTLFDEVEVEEINPQRPFDFADEAIPYLRIKDIQGGSITSGSSWLMPAAASNLDPRKKVRGGDVLLSKSGTIGKTGIVRDQASGGVASSGLFVLRVQPGIDPNYLVAYLQSEDARTWLDERARGSAARHLSAKTLESLPIPVPAMQVQERVIQAVNNERDDAIATLASVSTDQKSTEITNAIYRWIDEEIRRIALHRIVDQQANENRDTIESMARRKGIPVKWNVSANLISCLEDTAHYGSPLHICQKCGNPYLVDFINGTRNSPAGYNQVVYESCVPCFVDAGPSEFTIESIRECTALAPWAIAMSEAIDQMTLLTAIINDGASLLATLQATRAMFKSSQKLIPDSEKSGKPKHLVSEFLNLIDDCIKRMHSPPTIELTVSLASNIRREPDRFIVTVKNCGLLPVRVLRLGSVGLDIEEKRGVIPHLRDDDTTELELACLPVDGEQEVAIRWSGKRFNGVPFEGSSNLIVPAPGKQNADLQGEETPIDTTSLVSPYVCGDPITRERNDLFYGREGLIDQIRRQVQESGNLVLLEGNRRSGKSSILRHLEGTDSIPNWLCVYCSVHSAEGDNDGRVSAASFFQRFALQIARAVRDAFGRVTFPDGSIATNRRAVSQSVRDLIGKEMPFSDFQEFVETAVEHLEASGMSLLLMLDEFDKLQDDIERGELPSQFLLNLRSLVQSTPRFTMLITGSLRLQRLREEYWSALYGLGTRYGVTALSDDDARRLIVEPVNGMLQFSEEVIQQIISLTAGQPYLIQCVCYRAFDLATRQQVTRIKSEHMFDAIMELLQDNEHFAAIWDYAHLHRRKLLLAIIRAETKQSNSPPRFGMLQEKLADAGIFLPDEDLDRDLADLLELELIAKTGPSSDRKYGLAVPLMGMWIDLHQDIAVLKSRALTESEEQPTNAKIREMKHLSREVKRLQEDLEDE
ncbi:N-6 DNA methylase [Novipirellula artificiosorum]|uniref:N-6 DNA methylase n=1 Tax=Novipirellula artificiosorum TaxID=2528016 RepID=UPI0011B71D93|nr:N-6 DNA methylase [Novipirellula artificiosorum]